MSTIYRVKSAHLLIGLASVLAACSPDYAELAKFRPDKISCGDRTTPEIMHKVELDFSRVEEGEPGVDERHSSAKMRRWVYELLQSSKKMADSGNPYGMGFFGYMMQHELIVAYLDDKHIFTHQEAVAIKLPDSMKSGMVGALSYLYIASSTQGDPEKRAQEVINRIKHPGSGDNPTAPDYVHIPEIWLEDAKINADHWQAQCKASR